MTYAADSSCSPSLMEEQDIVTSEVQDDTKAEFPSQQQKSPSDVETSPASNKDDLDEMDVELTNTAGNEEGEINGQQPSTGQVTSTCLEDTATASSSLSVDNIGAISPTDARKFVPGFPYNEDMGFDASCAPLLMGNEKMTTSDVKPIRKTEIPCEQGKPSTDVGTLPDPVLIEAQTVKAESPKLASEIYPDEDMLHVEIERRDTLVDNVDNTQAHDKPAEQRCIPNWFVKACDRVIGILGIPVILIFGIILYLVDVGSDIVAGVFYFQEGHPGWGSLTITFVVLSVSCWAAVSWAWWYDEEQEEEEGEEKGEDEEEEKELKEKEEKRKKEKDRHPSYRRNRMLLSVLLLDPLVR